MTNDDLTQIYRQANKVPDGKPAPLTSEAVFAAMRAAMSLTREQCVNACRTEAQKWDSPEEAHGLHLAAMLIENIPKD